MDIKDINILRRLVHNDYEPFKEEYQEVLKGITNILSKYNEVEGNVFGRHLTDPKTYPRPEFIKKRRNLTLLSLTKNNILEIGFNAGHSAILLLTANPNLKYTAIDICTNPYVEECFEFLKSIFKERIFLIKGDSKIVLPELFKKDSTFDGYIIDGGHSTEIAFFDLLNITNFAKDGSILCFDDSDFLQLRIVVNYFMLQGIIIQIDDNNGFIPAEDQMFFRITK